MSDDERAQTVSEATTECAMQSWLPNFLPAEKHADLRELVFDLVFTAIHAFREDQRGWGLPEPSNN